MHECSTCILKDSAQSMIDYYKMLWSITSHQGQLSLVHPSVSHSWQENSYTVRCMDTILTVSKCKYERQAQNMWFGEKPYGT